MYICVHVLTICGMSTKTDSVHSINGKIHLYYTYKNTILMSKLQTLRNIQKNYKTRFFVTGNLQSIEKIKSGIYLATQ